MVYINIFLYSFISYIGFVFGFESVHFDAIYHNRKDISSLDGFLKTDFVLQEKAFSNISNYSLSWEKYLKSSSFIISQFAEDLKKCYFTYILLHNDKPSLSLDDLSFIKSSQFDIILTQIEVINKLLEHGKQFDWLSGCSTNSIKEFLSQKELDKRKLVSQCNKNMWSFTGNKNLHQLRDRAKSMFYHAYDNYMTHAFPKDELRPLTCSGMDTWGKYSLTLVDAMDMLIILKNYTEFRKAAQYILDNLDPMANVNVSLFETNIRIIGGLLSAHLLSYKANFQIEPGWPCSGPLLRKAEAFARSLLPAFNTVTGMPYGTVNLMNGVPEGETSISCTACIGTLMLEFGALSRLTGDPIFENKALGALKALYAHRSTLNMVGNHFDVEKAKWTAVEAGIGGAVDSYFEYLVKGSMLFRQPKLMEMFLTYRKAYDKYVKQDDWYFWAHMDKGHITMPVFQSLDAFWPGVLTLVGEVDQALRTLHNYHQVWKAYGFLPEFFNVANGKPSTGREVYPLRPELIESIYYVYRATNDPVVLQMGIDVMESIERGAKTLCGFATVHNVVDHSLEDRMESFFLAETTKYLYLLFDYDNILNKPPGDWVDTPQGKCQVWSGNHFFNTEAHPIDAGCLHCCHHQKQEDTMKVLTRIEDSVDLIEALNLDVTDDSWLISPLPSTEQESAGSKDDKLQDQLVDTVLNLLKPLLAGKPAEKELFDSALANITQTEKQEDEWEYLTCPVQPFHRRLTLYGQVKP